MSSIRGRKAITGLKVLRRARVIEPVVCILLIVGFMSSCGLSSTGFPKSQDPVGPNTMVSVNTIKDKVENLRVVDIESKKGTNYLSAKLPTDSMEMPRWSPDRRTMVFLRKRSKIAEPGGEDLILKSSEILTISADGGGTKLVPSPKSLKPDSERAVIGWTPDGRSLWYYTFASGILAVDEKRNIRSVAGDFSMMVGMASISPDGKHFAFISVQGDSLGDMKGIEVADIDGLRINNRRLLYLSDRLNGHEQSFLWWSPRTMTWLDNNQIAFLEFSSTQPTAETTDAVRVMDINTVSSTSLFQSDPQKMLTDLTLSPDGGTIAFLVSPVEIGQGIEHDQYEYNPEK